MSSSTNSKQDVPPPSYDQIAKIDIDSGTAPLLHETFSGSIFRTSTIVTFELTMGSRPTIVTSNSNIQMFEKPCDYTFIIRDFLGSVQANGKVSNLSPDLKTELQDARGTEILQVRRQVGDPVEPTNPPNAIMQLLHRATKKRENTVHTFEVFKNRMPVGVVKFGDQEPTETCLKMYLGNAGNEIVVKSFSRGDFSIFRDHSSSDPLCNLHIDPCEFKGKIIFHPETGITTEEQLLCSAAAFAMKTCLTRLDIEEGNDIAFKMLFWMLAGVIISSVGMYFLYLLAGYVINNLD